MATGILEERGTIKAPQPAVWMITKIVIASQFTSVINLFHAELNRKGISPTASPVKLTTSENVCPRVQKPTGYKSCSSIPRLAVVAHWSRADELVIADETFIPMTRNKWKTHSTGRVHSVIIHILRSLGSVEESILPPSNGM